VTESSSPANPGPGTPPPASAAQASEPTTSAATASESPGLVRADAGAASKASSPAPGAAAKPAADAKPAAKAKPPAPEEQPFERFVPDLLLPAIAAECRTYGGPAPELSFLQGPMPVVGSDCWMVKGQLPGERRFWLCFTSPDIQASKTVALAEAGAEPSLLESFLIDERKMTLALLVSRLVQRLNGQKWLGPN
jgi:hypothetical protein